MKMTFDKDADQTVLLVLGFLHNSVVDFKDAQGEVSGKLVDVQIDKATKAIVLMISRPLDNDWKNSEFTAPVPCVLGEDAELYVY